LDLIPNIKTYVDRCALLSRHRENCATAARRSHGADLNFDNGLTHTASLATRLSAKSRIAVASVATQRLLHAPVLSLPMTSRKSGRTDCKCHYLFLHLMIRILRE